MMTRISSTRSVGPDFWEGRLRQARSFQSAAEDAVALADVGENMTPAMSNMVLAAIAYADAITAKRRGIVNTQDHGAAPKLLRDTLGNALPTAQEGRYRRLLAHKDAD